MEKVKKMLPKFCGFLFFGMMGTFVSAQKINYQVNPQTGALQTLSIANDPQKMNWLVATDGSQYRWVKENYGWGLGYATQVKGNRKEKVSWEVPVEIKQEGNEVVYMAGDIRICVKRKMVGDELVEEYTFRNQGEDEVVLVDIGVYTPFNDNYPGARTCINARTNTHIWEGENAAYINALRMGGYAPHLGRPTEFPVVLPNGETIQVPVEPQHHIPHSDLLENGDGMFETSATVIKDAGDDPDITNGMKVVANIAVPFRTDDPLPEDTPQDDYNIIVCGGEGVGVVTMPGLGLELGSSAINDTPREMIKKNVKLCLERLHIAKQPSPILITISIPGGKEIAKRTFNPRLGIEGGISIIGTSGIVKPFSSEAFVNSIRKSMEVAKATRSPRIVISSGAKSERFIKAYYPDLPTQAFVHYGNFIGETLKIAAEEQVPHVTLGVMMGKAVKLAEGNLDTHSKKVTMNKEFIQDLARQTGCSEETLAAIGQMNLARELWDIIPEELLEKFGKALIELCHRHCDPLLPNGELTVLLITENGKIYS